jgi:hypothetical protein
VRQSEAVRSPRIVDEELLLIVIKVDGDGDVRTSQKECFRGNVQQNATQKLFRQEFLKGTYDLMKVL